MKEIGKVIMWVSFMALMVKACHMNYICDVVDSIPEEIRERIIEENPRCVDVDVLAEYWKTKGDSLILEIAAEQEYEREWGEYIKAHPEEFCNN